MKLVLVAGSYAPREGGAERQMRTILERLASDGCEAVVLTQAIAGSQRRESIGGVTVRRLGWSSVYARYPRTSHIVFAAAAFVHLVRIRPRGVVSLQMGSASLATAMARRILGFRHVVRLTGGGTAQFRSEPFARKARVSGQLLVKLSTNHSSVRLVAPAQHLIADFDEAFPKMQCTRSVIMNGVPVRIRKQPQALNSRTLVTWYSRLGGGQAHATFLRLAETMPDVEFAVFGKEIEARENITNLGWVDDVYPVLERAKVLLNTSPSEGMPNTVLQAISVGARVVGLKNNGLLEVERMFPDAVVLADNEGQLERSVRDSLEYSANVPIEVATTDDAYRVWVDVLIGKVKEQ